MGPGDPQPDTYLAALQLNSRALLSPSNRTNGVNYRKVSNIRRTEFQNLNDSRPVLQLSLPNLLKPCIKSRMKM